MDKPQTDNDTSSTTTQQPGEGREAEGDAVESLDEPLAEEHVRTQEQRNQAWTQDGAEDPRRGEGEPMRTDTTAPPTLDRPDALEDKMEEVMANPHSDAEEGHDEEMGLGGVPKTGSGEQDPMRNAQGSGSE